MNGVEPEERRRTTRSFRYGVAAIALCVGCATAAAPTVAWADTSDPGATAGASASADTAVGTDDTTTSSAPSSPRAAVDGQDGPGSTKVRGIAVDPAPDTDTDAAETDDVPDPAELPVEVADDAGTEPPSEGVPRPTQSAEPAADADVSKPVVAELDSSTQRGSAAAEPEPNLDDSAAAVQVATPPPSAGPDLVEPAALVAVTSSATVEVTTPPAPQPLSPFAELLQLPGRLINEVLEVLDLTTSANGPHSPISFAPINDLLFAAFREFERLVGLYRTPAPQPAVPALTYTGPTTAPTPTVAQLLNAAAAGYVLGGIPGGLVPFTVNGFQMSATNVLSGMVGMAWVTPEGQIIIAYQGTSGGSHLLFNPLIAISQVLADIQVIFTGTTPWAFHDALFFARWVRAEAARQGYASDDIFVTGHSLGGWEAQYVAQQIGLAGIGFEAPGMNTTVPGNGADSMFVTVATYGSPAPFMATDLPGLQPFMPAYVPGGGSKPHYGPIVLIGDPAAMTPMYNASALWGKGLIGSVIFLLDFLGNFFQYHLPGVQAYHLDVTPDPGMVTWLGTSRGPVHTGYGTLTIPQLMKAASDDGILVGL
jgi:hypothetical protein